jgi:hypothetical protein
VTRRDVRARRVQARVREGEARQDRRPDLSIGVRRIFHGEVGGYGVDEGGREDLLWVTRATNLIKGIDQGVLVLGFERNMDIHGGINRRVTHVRPISRGRIPFMLYVHIFPT